MEFDCELASSHRTLLRFFFSSLKPQNHYSVLLCPAQKEYHNDRKLSPNSRFRSVENLGKVLSPLLLEPSDGVLLGHALPVADTGLAELPPVHALASTLHDDVEIHTVNARVRVILDAKIDVLGDTETPVPVLGEVLALKLELLHGKALGDDVLGLLTAHGDVGRDLLVTPDTEGTHGVASCTKTLTVNLSHQQNMNVSHIITSQLRCFNSVFTPIHSAKCLHPRLMIQ